MVSALENRRRALMFQPHRATATGDVASFRTDVVSPLKMQFDLLPIQDLHGQANPYPPGGGKNKLDESAYTSLTQATYSNHVFTGTNDTGNGQAVFVRTFKNGTTVNTYRLNKVNVTVGSRNSVTVPFDDTFDSMDIGYLMSTADNFCARFTKPNLPDGNYTVSFKVDVFPEQGTYGKFSYIQLEAGSSMTDYAPYENICPITGHDGFTRTGTGKNLFDGEYTNCGITAVGVNYSISNSDSRVAVIPCKPNTTYTATKIESSNRFIICSADTYPVVGTQLTNYYNSPIEGTESKSFTTNGSAKYIAIGVTTSSAKEEPKMQVELGSTASDFEAYNGSSIETTFPTPPGTVYGCHVTDNGDGTGTLVVDKIGVDMSTLTWTGRKAGDINKLWSSTLPEFYSPEYSRKLGWMCDKFTEEKPSSAAMITPNTANVGIYSLRSSGDQSNTIYMVIPKADTPDGFLVYEIIEPQTYTLSLTALQSLIGQNNIWVDNADSVSVEYWGH